MDMRGVSRQKRAVHAIVRGLALVDMERRHPYRRQDADPRTHAIERGLKVAHRGLPVHRRRARLPVKHDDYARQFVVEPPHENDVAMMQVDAQLVAGNIGAAEFEIAQEEIQADRVALKGHVQAPAHHAVRAVAADQPARRNRLRPPGFMTQLRRHALLRIFKREKRRAALDFAAKRTQMLGEQPLRLVLRQE